MEIRDFSTRHLRRLGRSDRYKTMKIKVKVIPKSSQSKIEEIGPSELKIKLKSAPIKGQANEELIELLAGYYQVSKNQISIIRGLTSKNKIIEINNYGSTT